MRRLSWFRFSTLLTSVAGAIFLFLVVVTATTDTDGKAIQTHLLCKELASAAEAYKDHPENPGRRLPSSLGDLFHPPWGGPSLYKYGAEEPRDSWENPFRTEPRQMPDGRDYLFVWTEKPDGTKISQFGVGLLAEPP